MLLVTFNVSASVSHLILLTRFEFGSRRDLWADKSKYKYIPPPNFSAFMSCHRVESILSSIIFSHFMATDQIWGKNFEDSMTYGAAVLGILVDPWVSSKGIVCAGSYFSSVDTAQMLESV